MPNTDFEDRDHLDTLGRATRTRDREIEPWGGTYTGWVVSDAPVEGARGRRPTRASLGGGEEIGMEMGGERDLGYVDARLGELRGFGGSGG